MLGKENNRITRKISLIRKGNTPLNVSDILTSPAILLIIKTFNPMVELLIQLQQQLRLIFQTK